MKNHRFKEGRSGAKNGDLNFVIFLVFAVQMSKKTVNTKAKEQTNV
jgi:hypothetical protein